MACLFPFYVNEEPVPCGRCPQCLIRRTDGWCLRLSYEERRSRSVDWLCLTYSNDSLHSTPNGYCTLNKRDIQLFFKRLRKYTISHEKLLFKRALKFARTPEARAAILASKADFHQPIKYFLCGEYGSRYGRPHYHVFVFNSYQHLYERAWHDREGVLMGDIYIDKRPFSTDSVGYTCGYMFKKRRTGWKGDDRVAEFLMMSKKLGINYLTPGRIAYHKADPTRNFAFMPNGKRVALPRYFADQLYTAEDKEARADLMDSAIRLHHKTIYDEHVLLYGSSDDFIRSQAAARRAAVYNFQRLHSKRSD